MANQVSIPKVQTTDRNVNQLQQNIITAVNQLQQQVNSTNTAVTSLQQPAASPTSTIVRSTSSGNFPFSSTQIPVTDVNGNPLSVTVTTTGGDVDIGLMPDGIAGNTGYIISDSTPTDSSAYVFFFRDGIQIAAQLMYIQNNITIEIHATPSSTYRFIDSPPAGSHTYTVQVVGSANRGDQAVVDTLLYARPY